MTHSSRASIPLALLLLTSLAISPTEITAQEAPSDNTEQSGSSGTSSAGSDGDSEDDADESEEASGASSDQQEDPDDTDASDNDEQASDASEPDTSSQGDQNQTASDSESAPDTEKARDDGESPDGEDSETSEDERASDEEGTESEEDARTTDSGDSETDGQEASDFASPSTETADESDGSGADSTGDGEQASGDGGDQSDSPIAGLSSSDGDDEFEPVEDIEEESLQEITPTEVFPYLEWDGLFRVRSAANVNLDLDTGGSSAILPPAENNLPGGSDNTEARSDSELLWTTDMEFRLDPTIHLTESLRLNLEAELLDNLVFGSLSDHRLTGGTSQAIRPDPTRTVHSANQLFPREREWFENSLRINEAYGEIDTFLGLFRAGRMDNDWGLGIAANGGDCLDCDYGDHVDRIQFRTNAFGIYGSAAIDFPDQGETTQSPQRIDGQPYDVSQVDDARQYTFSVSKEAKSRKERKMRQQKLREDEVPVVSGGARFTLRNQKGTFVRGRSADDGGSADGTARNAELVYRGLDLYVPDLWGQFLYNPDPETLVRVELEAVGLFGSVDNTSGQPVGTASGEQGAVNCFDQSDRESNPEACTTLEDGTSTDQGIAQLGGALESELYFGGPVRFGFDTGYASGGGAPNWGYGATGGEALNFYRFDPNYHVDLILFREVIGTVTNAYYANPYAQARFFESPDRRMEVQLDAILSRAVASSGTPAGGENPWLGVELDGAVRYLQMETFQAGLEGGVLFPFDGLNGRQGRRRLTVPLGMEGSESFGSRRDASIAWTIQGNLYWQF